jgi:hypothetical protein
MTVSLFFNHCSIIRTVIKELIKSEDRNFIATQLKRWQVLAGTAVLFLIAQISSETVKFIYHFYFQHP